MASWVTSSVIPPYAARWRPSSIRSAIATPTSRPASGSSSSSSARVGGQRPGDRDPLRLPAGELARPAAGEVADAEPVEPVAGARRRPRPRPTPRRARPEGDVVERASGGGTALVLEDHADARGRGTSRGGPVHEPPSTATVPVGRHQSGQGAQQGGLAGAVGADDGDHLARRRRRASASSAAGRRRTSASRPVRGVGVTARQPAVAQRDQHRDRDDQQDQAERARGVRVGLQRGGRSASAWSGWCRGSCRRR